MRVVEPEPFIGEPAMIETYTDCWNCDGSGHYTNEVQVHGANGFIGKDYTTEPCEVCVEGRVPACRNCYYPRQAHNTEYCDICLQMMPE